MDLIMNLVPTENPIWHNVSYLKDLPKLTVAEGNTYLHENWSAKYLDIRFDLRL